MVVILLFLSLTKQITAAATTCENKAGIDNFLKITRNIAYVVVTNIYLLLSKKRLNKLSLILVINDICFYENFPLKKGQKPFPNLREESQ